MQSFFKFSFTIVLIFISTTLTAKAQVNADKFNFKTDLNGQELTIALDTDLPEDTDLMFSIYRIYYKKGEPKTPYSFEYFDQKMSVKDWNGSKTFTLDNNIWKSGLKAFQDNLVPAGSGFEVAKIADDVKISFTVPFNQSNPAFGEMNSKLSGKVVKVSEYGGMLIEKEKYIYYPLEDKTTLKKEIEASASQYKGQWQTNIERSKVDDSTNVTLILEADSPFISDMRQTITPTLYVRCEENKTQVFVDWDVFLGVDSIPVLYRFDTDNAKRSEWSVSTDYKAAFVSEPINFIHKLMNSEKLLVQVIPHSSNEITTEFFVEGLRGAIKPLQEACGWQ